MKSCTHVLSSLCLSVAMFAAAAFGQSPTSNSPWAVKSHRGGGYAGKAIYNAPDNQLVFTGTLWEKGFLLDTLNETGVERPDGAAMTCFMGVIDLGAPFNPDSEISNQRLSRFRTIPDAHLCSSVAMLYEQVPDFDVDETESFSPWNYNFVQESTALLMGSLLFYDGTGMGHHDFGTPGPPAGPTISRIQEALSLVDTADLETRSERIASDFQKTGLETLVGKPSLHDGFSEYASAEEWNQTTYHHQSRPFMYAAAVVPQQSGSIQADLQGFQHHVYVIVLSADSVPTSFHGEFSKVRNTQQYRELEFLDFHSRGGGGNGKTVLECGVQKLDANNGILNWYFEVKSSDPSATRGSSVLTSVVYMESIKAVVIAGSTSTYGPALGASTASSGDWDGFITLLDPDTGFMKPKPNNVTDVTIRVDSQPDQHDFINAICHLDDDVYAVGTTTGKITGDDDGGVFVIKFDVNDNFRQLWKEQIVAPGTEGLACAVSKVGDENVLYIGGTMPEGMGVYDDTIQRDEREFGSSVFVAQMNEPTGTVSWMSQIEYDPEKKRFDDIKSLNLDGEGHAIVYGNSYDPLVHHNDIFLVSLDRTSGDVGDLDFSGHSSMESLSGSSMDSSPDSSEGFSSPDGSDNNSDSNSMDGLARRDSLFGNENLDESMLGLFIALPILLVFVVCILAACDRRRRGAQQAAEAMIGETV